MTNIPYVWAWPSVIVLKTLKIMTAIGRPGKINPAMKGEITFKDNVMLDTAMIIHVGTTNTKARMTDTKNPHQGSCES